MNIPQFSFTDYAQNYYSSTTKERFYQVISNKNQLTKILLTPESLKQLQKQSKTYLHKILISFSVSLILLYPMNKFISFGSGFTSYVGKFFMNSGLLAGTIYYTHIRCKENLNELKKKIYDENRANFRKYQLTGDVMQASSHVKIVDQ